MASPVKQLTWFNFKVLAKQMNQKGILLCIRISVKTEIMQYNVLNVVTSLLLLVGDHEYSSAEES
jgi:hypothetical protein